MLCFILICECFNFHIFFNKMGTFGVDKKNTLFLTRINSVNIIFCSSPDCNFNPLFAPGSMNVCVGHEWFHPRLRWRKINWKLPFPLFIPVFPRIIIHDSLDYLSDLLTTVDSFKGWATVAATVRRSDGTDSFSGSWKSLVGVITGNSDVSVPHWSLFDAILPCRGMSILGRLAFRGAPGHVRCIKLSTVITSSGGGEPGRG